MLARKALEGVHDCRHPSGCNRLMKPFARMLLEPGVTASGVSAVAHGQPEDLLKAQADKQTPKHIEWQPVEFGHPYLLDEHGMSVQPRLAILGLRSLQVSA